MSFRDLIIQLGYMTSWVHLQFDHMTSCSLFAVSHHSKSAELFSIPEESISR